MIGGLTIREIYMDRRVNHLSRLPHLPPRSCKHTLTVEFLVAPFFQYIVISFKLWLCCVICISTLRAFFILHHWWSVVCLVGGSSCIATLTSFCLISPLWSLSNSATGYMQGKANSPFFSVALIYYINVNIIIMGLYSK